MFFLKAGSSVNIVDMGVQNIQDAVKSAGLTYFHCTCDKERIEIYNAVLAENAQTDNDILLIDESLFLSLSKETFFYQELKDVLYYTEKHAFVSPRIDFPDDPVYYNEYLKLLPRFFVIDSFDIRCVLIKKRVINLLLNFNCNYSSFAYALLDFEQRAKCFGFSTVQSNHSLLLNQKNYLEDSNIFAGDEKLFLDKYPYYVNIKRKYSMINEKHPMDRFLLLFTKKDAKKRIILNYYALTCTYSGTTEFQLAFAESFFRLYQEKYNIFIYTNHPADDFHGLSRQYPNVLFPDTISGVFDLGFCAYQPYGIEDHIFLNKYCLKSIFSILDIILLRCEYIFNENQNNIVLDDFFKIGFKICDGVISISDYSTEDYKAYFIADKLIQNKPVKRVYISSGFCSSAHASYNIPFDNYFLIVGNHFKHKALLETIEAVTDTAYNYIVISSRINIKLNKNNVYSYTSGKLSEDFINYLYAKCKAVIFPSIYEGFGLPVAVGLKNKKRIIVYNSAINKELFQHFMEFKDYFYFFDRFSQINEIIDTIDFSILPTPVEYKDTWDKTTIEVEAFFDEILNTKIDIDKLNERWHLYNILKSLYDSSAFFTELAELKNSRSWRITKPLRNLAAFVRRHKVLYFFAKGLLSIKEKMSI